MKTRVQRCVFLIVAIIALSASALANNNLFLPGDAYFPTVLTKHDIESLQRTKTDERTFVYSSFGGYEEAFCGYAGYKVANIPAVDDEFAKNLAKVYATIRKSFGRELLEKTSDGKTELIETNGIRVLFYPPEFKFPQHYLGLRYNENWVSEALEFGHKREHLRLCSLIADPDAMEISWRDADVVPPLKTQLPDVKLQAVPETTDPIVVQGPVKAIVFGRHTLKELFLPTADDYQIVYIIDAKGITEWNRLESDWEEFKFE
jgi:hypothetical protein